MGRCNSYVEKLKRGQLRLWKGAKPILSTLDIELTERCNNKCIHCYINQSIDNNDIKRKELDTKDVKSIIDEAAALGCLTIRFTGGEPLLREDFEELYIHTRKLGIKVVLFTNATLITPHLAALLSKIPPLETIEISYYGMRKNTYETVSHVPGSFEAAGRGIRLLSENKVPFGIKSVLLPEIIAEIDNFENWVAKISGSYQRPSYAISLDLRCRRDSVKKNSQIKELRLTPDETIMFLAKARKTDSILKRQYFTKFTGIIDRSLFTCGAGVRSGSIDAYGSYQLCLLLRHPKTVYNLKNGTLREAILGFAPDIRALECQNPEYINKCARCFLKGLCDQCPGKSWTEHGTLDTPVDYLCNVAHAKAKDLGLIEGNEKAWQIDEGVERITQCSNRSNIN